MNLYLGCPIWAFKGWVGNFYPQGTKPADYLYEYARRLNAVEGNTTFYAIPAPKTLQRWVEETPETFRFCPKLPRTISHAGKLAENLEQARQFLKALDQLGSRLGPVFLQLPPSYSPALLDDLQVFLESWPSHARLAVEVRHPAWFEASYLESLTSLLSEHQAARVAVDPRPVKGLKGTSLLRGSVYQRLLQLYERKPELPGIPQSTAPFVFLRYIGHPQMELNTPYLAEWANRISEWLQQGLEAYIFCHCPDERLDPWLCREAHRLVSANAPILPLPWDEAD